MTGVTAKAMRAELNKLVNGIKDPNYKAVSVGLGCQSGRVSV